MIVAGTPRYDRFGWYWQPAQWLQNMDAQDAVDAAAQAINIKAKGAALQLQAKHQQQRAAQQRQEQTELLQSLWGDE